MEVPTFTSRTRGSWRGRHQELTERRLEGIGQAMVQVSAQLLRTLFEGIANLDRKIEEAASAHPDFFIFKSLPGAGSALAPPLLAALGSQRDRYGSAEEVQKHSGIAPVMEKSGKKKWVHFRRACPKFLRQSFHEWAGHSIAQSTWARAYYQQQRGRGKDHHAAVRALAFKWIRILFRCWQDRVAYDENKYLAALAKRGSPLSSVLTVTAATLSNSCAFLGENVIRQHKKLLTTLLRCLIARVDARQNR